jgi:hypothetical protein
VFGDALHWYAVDHQKSSSKRFVALNDGIERSF